jgi:hypothetical protein
MGQSAAGWDAGCGMRTRRGSKRRQERRGAGAGGPEAAAGAVVMMGREDGACRGWDVLELPFDVTF